MSEGHYLSYTRGATSPPKETVFMRKNKEAQQAVAVAAYPEKGSFTEELALKKHIKKLEDAQLVEWMGLEGLSHTPAEHVAINRMRMAMAIKELHFPSEPKQKKSNSPYKQYETEQLISMIVDHDVPVEPTEDMKIMRMRCIMALRAHKIIV
jgi:hypothetical protein